MKQTIVFTGGGSAGHVTANLVLMARLLQEGGDIHYIGSGSGIERRLVGSLKPVRYHAVATGKLRRYFSWTNVTDIFRILLGILQAWLLVRRIRPEVVFSLGGFVSVPVVIGAWLNGVPILLLEPDLHPGLANRLSLRFARMMCTVFMETAVAGRYPRRKMLYVGPIVREELKLGSRLRGMHLCGFKANKPILLIMGGSQGADAINRLIRGALPELLIRYQVVHICGTGKTDASIAQGEGYRQFEYVHDELPDLIAMADLVISRAGSNAIHEWLELRKPMLLIPHTVGASRRGQVRNAEYFKDKGYAELLHEQEMTRRDLLNAIDLVYRNRKVYVNRMRTNETGDAVNRILDLIRISSRTGREA